MPAHKFMVIPLKELIKTVLLTLLGLAILLGIAVFVARQVQSIHATYVPGVYATQVDLEDGSILVEVTVSHHDIEDVTVSSLSETVPVFYPQLQSTAEALCGAVVKAQSTEIDYGGDLAVTSGILLDAMEQSLDQARK